MLLSEAENVLFLHVPLCHCKHRRNVSTLTLVLKKSMDATFTGSSKKLWTCIFMVHTQQFGAGGPLLPFWLRFRMVEPLLLWNARFCEHSQVFAANLWYAIRCLLFRSFGLKVFHLLRGMNCSGSQSQVPRCFRGPLNSVSVLGICRCHVHFWNH